MKISDIHDDGPRTLTIGKIKLPWPFPVAYLLHSSGTRVFGRPVFGTKNRFIRISYKCFCKISDAKYWCIYRLYPTRYHWVDTKLEPGYYDPDWVMLHAAFACLGRYIEESGGVTRLAGFSADLRDPGKQDKFGPGSEAEQAEHQDEAVTLWQWWTEEKPREEAERDRLLDILFGGGRKTYSVPTDNPNLVEIKFKPFEGDEEDLYKKFRELEAKIDEDEQVMLHRLIDIRRSLWV